MGERESASEMNIKGTAEKGKGISQGKGSNHGGFQGELCQNPHADPRGGGALLESRQGRMGAAEEDDFPL